MKNRISRLEKLKRLGIKRGTRHINMPAPKPRPTEPRPAEEPVPLHFLNYEDDLQHAAPIEAVVPGQIVSNSYGAYFSFEARYPLPARYGRQSLARLPDIPMSTVAAITGDDAWLPLSWRDVLFLDTETTGLEIAAGTVAFLIGVGYLEGNDFVVRQVFMRDFNEETALLHDLAQLCQRFKALVTFNGKTFDVPVLENRFVLARQVVNLFDGPHFDLLHPARRVWRRRLDNCKLGTLETDVLGLARTQADIPGYFIPSLYRKYLVDQDARPMAGIFYHNELDVVSMAALAALLGQHFQRDAASAGDIHPIDQLSVGLWQLHLGQTVPAEATLRTALGRQLPPDLHRFGLTQLACLLKRQQRWAEAEARWQELVAFDDNLSALEELAKYYEWREKDFRKAMTCIDYAQKLLETWPQSLYQKETRADWQHRQRRVQRKLMTKG